MTNPRLLDSLNNEPEKWAKYFLEEYDNKKNIKKDGEFKKVSFREFKKEFFKGLKNNKHEHIKFIIQDNQLKKIYNASGLATQNNLGGKQKIKEQPQKPAKIKVLRKGKTYIRTAPKKWASDSKLILEIVAKKPVHSKEYKNYVANIMESTGRTRQAVIKKIQRTRQQLNKGGKK